MLSQPEPSPPSPSSTITTTTTTTTTTTRTPPPCELPLTWPQPQITLDWIQKLISAFDWSSRTLSPADFPSVLPVSVSDILILTASKILHKEPNCVTIDDLDEKCSVVVVGDVHGQFHDLVFLLKDAGFPSNNRFYVFNGDYVDRGAWGLETFLLLLAWKVFMPHRVFLLRGNHESKYCTSVYGFEQEVMAKYGDQGKHVYRKCLGCFEGLPLASIIAGRVYTAHGGLFRSIHATPSKRSKGKKGRKVVSSPTVKKLSLGSLEDLSKARRLVSDPPWEGINLIPGDVLWSDPSMIHGLSPNNERGIGLLWGPDCTEEFLRKYNLKLIIRSHEGPDAREKRVGLEGMGKGYTVDHEVESGKLITVFSAPDYPQFQATEERYNNKGAYIVLEPPNFDIANFHSFEAITPRPKSNAYYSFEDVMDSDEELDLLAMEVTSEAMLLKPRTTRFSHASGRSERRGDKDDGDEVNVVEGVSGSCRDSGSGSDSNKGSGNGRKDVNVDDFGNEDDNMDVDSGDGDNDDDINGDGNGGERLGDGISGEGNFGDEHVQGTLRHVKRKRVEKGKKNVQREVKFCSYIKTTQAMEEAKNGVFGGGPLNNLFLSDYEHHVSREVWHGYERGLLKLEIHVSKFEQWRVADEHQKFKTALKKTGFWNTVSYHYKHHNVPLISSLVERWYPDTNTFHLPFGEMTITLDDVKQILGVPILGDAPFCSSKISMEKAKSLLESGLGLPEEEIEKELSKKRSGGTSVSNEWLKLQFMNKINSSSKEKEVHCAVRAYLLFLFGCLLFPDKSGTQISIAYLELLLDFNNISNYAWGVAILCYTYHCLGDASYASVMHIAGFVTLIEAWAYEHFPIFRVPPNADFEEGLPRIARWSNFLSTYPCPENTLVWFRQCLDKMTPMEVYWDPYWQVRNVRPLNEKAFFHGVIGVLDMTESYHAERVLRQLGHVQHIPGPPLKPKSKTRNVKGARYDVHYKIAAKFINQWESHVLSIETRGRRAITPWECESDYLTWFCETCHPVMTPDDKFSTLHMPPPCDWENVIDEASNLMELGLQRSEDLSEEARSSFKKAHRYIKARYVLPDPNTEEN